MIDPRIIEIEFLSYLEQETPSSLSYWDWEKRGVRHEIFNSMVFDLFCDDCLDGQSGVGIMASGGSVFPAQRSTPPLREHARGPVDQAVKALLTNTSFSAYINHRGRLRLWRLRDEVQKARTKEKFGILWDRRHWDADAAIQLAMKAKGSASAVLFMDLDNFKPVNDRLGHLVGDEVLQIFFQNVAKLLVGIGEAYAWGGDEVVVLVQETTKEAATALSEAIRDAVATECSAQPKVAEVELPISVSIGTYIFADRQPASALVKAADALMYEDKNRKRPQR